VLREGLYEICTGNLKNRWHLISSLELGNFRAFKSENFDFSRLNIFVGPNNSGKSSALSALNLLAQSVSRESFGGGPIILNGPFDQLGTFKDMVHGGRANTPMSFSFSIGEYKYDFELKYRIQRREVELSKFNLTENSNPVYEYSSTSKSYNVKLGGKDIESLGPGIRKSRPKLTGFLPTFQEAFSYYRLNRGSDSSYSERVHEFLRHNERKIGNFRRIVLETFHSYDTLGAFREMPQRTYLFSGEVSGKIGRNGQNTITMLANDSSRRGGENMKFVDDISNWFRATGIAEGVKVKHLTDRHFELVVVGKDGSDHNICDVGFGCSQVLPVLVAGLSLESTHGRSLSKASPILVIQEPEIHLHPNAQAELGSFFASLTEAKGQIFLETHSDSLVLRIARHVASGDIPADFVRIFFIQDIEGLKRVTRMEITDEGGFTPDWPGGFFPQRQAESFALAKASLEKMDDSSQPRFSFRVKDTKK